MSQQTKKPLQELLNTQNSTEETNTNRPNYSEGHYTFDRVEKTPFYIIGDETRGYTLVSGTYQLCEYMDTKEEVIEYFNNHPWEITITLVTMIIHMTAQIKEHESKLQTAQNIQNKLEG